VFQQGLTRRTTLGGVAALSFSSTLRAQDLTKASIALLRLSSMLPSPILICHSRRTYSGQWSVGA